MNTLYLMLKTMKITPFAHGQPNSPSIRVEAARGEALVGAVEEGEQLLGANHVGHLAPLLMAKVDAFRIRIRTDDNEYRILLECISLDKNIWNGGGYQPFLRISAEYPAHKIWDFLPVSSSKTSFFLCQSNFDSFWGTNVCN